MKSLILNLARMLMVEQRYRAIKASPSVSGSDMYSVNRKLGNFLFVSYSANSASFAVFAFLLITPYIFSPGGVGRVANIGFAVYIYALIISVYSSALFFNAIGTMRLMEPVAWLPYKDKAGAVFLSWFIYNGSCTVFMVLPSVVWTALSTGNAAVFAFGITWSLIVILAGYAIGAVLNIIISGRTTRDRAGILSTIKSSLRIFIILMVFAAFEVGIYMPGAVPSLIARLPFPVDLLMPLLNIPDTVFLGPHGIDGLLVDIGSTALYSAVAILGAAAANRKAIGSIIVQSGRRTNRREAGAGELTETVNSRVMFMKDARIVARKSQNVVMLFIPVIFVFPTILSVLIDGSPGGIRSIGTYFSLMSVLIVCSGFYSLIMVVSEGNGISALFSLPVSLREVVYSKSSFGLLVFSVIIVPVTLIIMSGSGRVSPFDILVPANLILGYTFTSIFNIRGLIRRLPRESSTVNFYSFGGGLFLVFNFFLTGVMALAPVLASAVLTAAIYRSLFANPYFFYLADAFFNLAALVMVLAVTGRDMDRNRWRSLPFS